MRFCWNLVIARRVLMWQAFPGAAMSRFGGIVFGLVLIALGILLESELEILFLGCKVVYYAASGRDVGEALK